MLAWVEASAAGVRVADEFGVDGSVLTNAIGSSGSYTTGISGAPMYTGALTGLFG